MSRSRKKLPITGIAKNTSDKEDKRKANRALRRIVKASVEDNQDLNLRDVSDVWSFSKDGKRYWRNEDTQTLVLRK